MGQGNSTSVSLVIIGREMRQQFIAFSYIMPIFNVCQDRFVGIGNCFLVYDSSCLDMGFD